MITLILDIFQNIFYKEKIEVPIQKKNKEWELLKINWEELTIKYINL